VDVKLTVPSFAPAFGSDLRKVLRYGPSLRAQERVSFSFGNSVTFLEIEYAAPLAVNGIVSCDLGFCPKLERNIRIED
jgi:hypothetical protein